MCRCYPLYYIEENVELIAHIQTVIVITAWRITEEELAEMERKSQQ
jgi:hypothetical protein